MLRRSATVHLLRLRIGRHAVDGLASRDQAIADGVFIAEADVSLPAAFSEARPSPSMAMRLNRRTSEAGGSKVTDRLEDLDLITPVLPGSRRRPPCVADLGGHLPSRDRMDGWGQWRMTTSPPPGLCSNFEAHALAAAGIVTSLAPRAYLYGGVDRCRRRDGPNACLVRSGERRTDRSSTRR